MRMRYLVVLTVLSICGSAAFAADNYRGRTIGAACFGCHGAGGMSGAAIPPIIMGAPTAFIESALKGFRDGSRPSTIMGRISKGYTDDDIAAVAQYLSTRGGE